jgi:hypothetical protein
MSGLEDLLGPLVEQPEIKPKPKIVVPGAEPLEIDVAAYERALAEAERERARRDAERKKLNKPRTIIVERSYIDPCGDFTVSWGGTKRCQPRKVTKHELVYANQLDAPDAPGDDQGAKAPPPSGGSGPFPNDSSGSPPPLSNGSAPNSSPGGAPPPPAASPPPTPSGSAAGGGRSGPVADANGFKPVGPYTIRIDDVAPTAGGAIDVNVTFATPTAAKRLIGNGDWRVLATDEDGVSIDTTAIYLAGTGAPAPFDTMPYVSATTPAKARFRVALAEGMSRVRSVSAIFTGAPPATFEASLPGASAGTAEPASTAPFTRLKWFEVRQDHVKSNGRTTELTFSARNHTDALQYAAGTRLVFSVAGSDGKRVQNSGRVYPVRGLIGRQYEGVSVLPRQTGRFRVVFDLPNVRGPITVTDGAITATLAAPAVAEPVW